MNEKEKMKKGMLHNPNKNSELISDLKNTKNYALNMIN